MTDWAKTPWTLQHLETAHNGYQDWNTYVIRSMNNIGLATVGDIDRHGSEKNHATAKLMAAAPELFMAVDAAIPLLRNFADAEWARLPDSERWQMQRIVDVFEQAKAARLKAIG